MRTDSFSKEKHLPVRRFIADESKVATGLYGPRAIADDLDNLFNMFDPDSTFLDGSEKGGISEKNLQNGAVTYEKLAEEVKEKFQGIATEQQLESLRTELTEKNDTKADQSDTFTKSEVTTMQTAMNERISMAEQLIDTKASKSDLEIGLAQKADQSTTYTKTEVDGLVSNTNVTFDALREAIAKKVEETVLYEDVVNTPEWAKQPACEGVLDSAFTTTDFYYVTLKDANGNDLPSGQFMLKDFYTEDAAVYSTVFTLPALDTGVDTLVENYPVEFTSVGVHFRMRDAGVGDVTFTPDQWMMSGNRGQLRLVCSGEYVQRMSGAYFVTIGISDKNVSHYHSTNTTSFQSDSTKQIIPSAVVSSVQSYKTNQFYDDFTVERLSDTHYLTKRNMTMRCMSYGGTAYTVSSQMVIGHGELLNKNTMLNSISIRTAVKNDRGFIRNGSVIRVTEVK